MKALGCLRPNYTPDLVTERRGRTTRRQSPRTTWRLRPYPSYSRANSYPWSPFSPEAGPSRIRSSQAVCDVSRGAQGSDDSAASAAVAKDYLAWKQSKGTSLIRNSPPLGPYCGTLHIALWWPWGRGLLLLSEVPLQGEPSLTQTEVPVLRHAHHLDSSTFNRGRTTRRHRRQWPRPT